MFRLAICLVCSLLAGAAFAAGTVAPTTQTLIVSWDSNTPVAAGTVPLGTMPWASGKVVSCTYYQGGSSASFTATLQIGSTAVTGCNAISVSSSTANTVSATANNTFTSASLPMSLVISSVVGTPITATFQINIQTTAN